MESLLSGISQHGYSILFLAVFLESIAIPVPAALALLLAGGASASGPLHVQLALASALSAMLLGDTLMYKVVPPPQRHRNRELLLAALHRKFATTCPAETQE